MGTFIGIKIEADENGAAILDDAFAAIRKMEKAFSVFEKGSEISRLNRLKKMQVSDETLRLIKKSNHISLITKGAFDITCKPLTDLYREAEKRNSPPSGKEIKAVLQRTGWQKIIIKGNCVELPAGGEIDPGGIAKGYIVDRTADFLKAKGVKNAVVNAGGDIYAFGKNEQGKKWRIGIRDPFDKDSLRGVVEVSGFALATSGDYERHFTIKKKKYGHIINPATGISVQNSPAGVTVSAPDCATADALATAFFVLGATKSIRIADTLEGVEVFIIGGDKKIHKSKKFSTISFP